MRTPCADLFRTLLLAARRASPAVPNSDHHAHVRLPVQPERICMSNEPATATLRSVAEFDYERGKNDALAGRRPRYFGRRYLEGYRAGEKQRNSISR